MNTDMLLYLIWVMAALSAGTLAYLVMSVRPTEEVVGAGASSRGSPINSAFLGLALGIARALAPLHQNAINRRSGKDLERRLKQAGRPFGLTVPEFLGLRYVGAVVGLVLGYVFSLQAAGEASLNYVLPFTLFGFFYPGMRLKAVGRDRLRRMFRDMPYVLDLLTLSTEAGLDFTSAMATVIEKGPAGPLVEEFRISHQETILGKTRSDSLRAMAERVDLTELTSFILALIQAEQLGASVAKVLRTMSEQMRVKRSTMAEEAAGKVPVKLMAPLVICIFPASFIVLFVPLYLRATLAGAF